MTTKPIPRIGLRHILGLELFPGSTPQHYVKRPLRRLTPGLLPPKSEYAEGPFEALLYGKDAQLLTVKKTQLADEAVVKPEEKKEEPSSEGKKDGNGNGKKTGKKNGNGNGRAEGNKGDAKKDDKAAEGGGGPGPDAKPSDDFTKAEDEELMKLKNEGAQWAAIAASMGKPTHLVKQRFGQIKPKDWRPPQGGGKGKKGGEEKNVEVTSEEKKEEPKTGEAKTAKEKEASSEKGRKNSSAKKRGSVKGSVMGDEMTSIYEFEGKEYKRRTADEQFPTEVLQYAGEFDDNWYWLNLASRMFDKYGKRYTPEELKAKLG